MTERHRTNIHIEGDHEVAVHVADGGNWFRLFRQIVQAGLWAKMSASACRVYVVLAEPRQS